jgi:hypothetical protein
VGRVWLDVPYKEKDEAKAAGARWDPNAKRWYAQNTTTPALSKWAAQPDIPDRLPGEDRSFGSGLFVDLVPSSCWFTNVRSCVDQRDWERLRRMLLTRASQACEICGRGEDREVQRWLEAHERWFYDEATTTQVLRRLICVCTDCHRTTHFGLARIKGKEAVALQHLRVTTGMTASQADAHVRKAFSLWDQRSRRDWKLDLTMLTSVGITLARPPESSQRRVIAGEELIRSNKSVTTSSNRTRPQESSEQANYSHNQPVATSRSWWKSLFTRSTKNHD